jgi:predicted ferric reductase
MTDPRMLWWIDRSAGLVSLVLLTAVMVLGLLSTGRPGAVLAWRATVQGLHRELPLVASVLLSVHIGTAVMDSFVPLTPLDVVVPFRAGYRPLWLGLGTLSIDILVTIIVTSLLRARMGQTSWRWVHRLAYALWPLAMLHALGSGSDAKTDVVQLIGVGCIGLVMLAAGWRVATVAR